MEVPVIFDGEKSVNDRVKGLRMGAEDYIVKPFEIVELLARVEVVLRRRQLSEESMDLCGLHIDIRSMRVQRDGREIPLTKKDLTCSFCLREIPTRLSTGRPSTSGSGEENFPTAAERWIFWCSDCGKRWDGTGN